MAQDKSAQTLVEVKGLVNKFGSHVVHDGLDLTMRRGEILGLVGGSGSGKSVLLRSILGLHKPTDGQILIRGRDLHALSRKEQARLGRSWGVLFQDGALFSGLTTIDNIAFPLREFTDLDEKSIDRLARFKLQITGLKPEAADKWPSELSGGMIKRAGLARALALDPHILFLDEPTAGLDPLAAAAFDELILQLRDMLNLSVLIITHDLDTLVSICDRVAMIVDKKAVSGTIAELTASKHPQVAEYFNGSRMRAAQSTTGGDHAAPQEE